MSSEVEYRVLWTDAAGEGRFTSVQAANLGEAGWKAAQIADSASATFVEVEKVDRPTRGTAARSSR